MVDRYNNRATFKRMSCNNTCNSCSGDNRECRELKMRLKKIDFSIIDTVLYLDAYPSSREALECYNKYKRLENQARKEYETRYGWITAPSEAASWEWTNGPWPWQIDKEGK